MPHQPRPLRMAEVTGGGSSVIESALGWMLADSLPVLLVPLIFCVTLDDLLNLSRGQIFHLESGINNNSPF